MKFIYSLIIALIITIGAAALSDSTENNLQNGILRLHIIADSDYESAQEIKLEVRDEIIRTVDLKDSEFQKKAVSAANKILKQKNVPYSAHSETGKFYFPEKRYNNIVLPEGYYYGVRIVLGSGAGKNWWCIMYPPLCAVSDTEMEMSIEASNRLKRQLTPDTYELVTSNDGKVKIKFKAVEIIRSIKCKMRS